MYFAGLTIYEQGDDEYQASQTAREGIVDESEGCVEVVARRPVDNLSRCTLLRQADVSKG
jgi:hypothetical protein